jgi:NNP family nitrate/nitrite transporter-like MFS transporter
MRPIGGSLADKVGGIKALSFLYALAAVFLFVVSLNLSQEWMALAALVLGMQCLGMGNGAVFQLVPQRFRREIGVMTGLVGMAGGVGGFCLAMGLGYAKQLSGGYAPGFVIFSALALLAWVGLFSVKKRWRTTWGAAHIAGARV